MDMQQSCWLQRYQELSMIRGKPPRIPHTHPNSSLRDWLSHQKGLYALGILRPDRAKALSQLGVDWSLERGAHDLQWDSMIGELLAFRQEHGHCMVYQRYGALGQWLSRQRMLWRRGALPASRIAQLHALGVDIRYSAEAAIPSSKNK